jgi:DNA-binding LacI/PurR family transcriptional regulator
LQTVADECGVSRQTVCQILNRGRTNLYRSETVARVQRAARKLGYRLNYHAASLQAGRAFAVGMLLRQPRTADLWGNFWAPIIGGVATEAQESGYHFVAVTPEPDMLEVESGIRFVAEGRVDLLVAPGFLCTPACIARLETCPAPVVLVEYDAETVLPVVELDDEGGVRAAIDHLGALGHRSVLWMGPEAVAGGVSERRRRAFREAVDRGGMDAQELIVEWPGGSMGEVLEHRVGNARRGLLALLRGAGPVPPFSAIVCYSDAIALGAYAALAEAGLHIPQDVSVTGFDDIYGLVASPPMTTVSHMLEEMGRRSARIGIKMLKEGTARKAWQTHRERVGAELVVRQSTALVSPERG